MTTTPESWQCGMANCVEPAAAWLHWPSRPERVKACTTHIRNAKATGASLGLVIRVEEFENGEGE